MLNRKVCVSGGTNLGFGDCTLDVKNIIGAILVPQNTVITESQMEDLGAYLHEKVNHADPNQRFYPIHGFEEIADNSEDVSIETLGYGGKAVSKEGDYDWTLRFINGGMCLLKSLRKFNGTKKDVFFYDADGHILGSSQGDGLRSIQLTLFYTPPWKANDGSSSTNYGVRFGFKPVQVNDDLGFIDTSDMGLILTSFKALQNLMLKAVDPENAPAVKIKAVTGCDRRDLFDTYEVELEDPALWRAYTRSGVQLNVTSVTADPASLAWVVTVDSADETYYVELVNPMLLSDAGVEGFESRRVMIEVTPA